MKEQFSGSRDDAALHLNNFVELCDMQKYKEVDGVIVKIKTFPFSLIWRAKEWLQGFFYWEVLPPYKNYSFEK